MKKLKTGLLLSVIGCLTFFATMLSACGSEKVTLSTTGDVTSLKPGDSVQLLIDGNTPEGFTFKINEGANYAEIDENGVLTININAVPGNKVKVSAEKEKAKSNEITLTVDSINLTSLVAIETVSEVMRNNHYDLTYTQTPTNTTEAISWVIVDGADYAEIVGNKLMVNSTAPYESKIKVQAQGQTMSSNVLEFKVVEVASEGLTLRGEDEVEKLDAAGSDYTYTIDVRDGQNQSVAGKNLTFTVTEGQNNIAVYQNGYNFTLRALGHGIAKLRINLGSEYKDVEVNCVKAPEAITLPEVLQTKTNIEFTTGVNQDIANFNLNFVGTNVCQDVTYKFEKYDEEGDYDTEEERWIEDATAGSFNAGTLTLKAEGKIRVTATSNSGSSADAFVSVSKEFVVNDGINVSTFEEFKAALVASTGKAINIVNMQSNKLIPAFITANDQTSANILSVTTLVSSGELTLLGNGYEVDLSGLAKETSLMGYMGGFIKVSGQADSDNSVAHHKVVIKDFTVIGNTDIEEMFHANTGEPAGKLNRAIEIGGDDINVSYLVDINNVKVSKFGVGIRVSHAVSSEGKESTIKNTTIQNIWSNGIELAASQIRVDSINVQRCGAFALEISPDSYNLAGLNFNQPQTVQFAGDWDVQNMNDGNTPYLVAFAQQLASVNTIITGSTMNHPNATEVMKNIQNDNQELNMIALVFNGNSGNGSVVTDGVFANSIINYNDLTGIDTTHKYIQVDLVFMSMNLGRAYLYNLNYAG